MNLTTEGAIQLDSDAIIQPWYLEGADWKEYDLSAMGLSESEITEAKSLMKQKKLLCTFLVQIRGNKKGAFAPFSYCITSPSTSSGSVGFSSSSICLVRRFLNPSAATVI